MRRIKKLYEFFQKIGTFDGIGIYDIKHVKDRFKERFPRFDFKTDYLKVLQSGLNAIKHQYKMEFNNYVIISKSLRIKIPVHFRPDKIEPNKSIFALMTTLDADEHVINIKRDIQIFVENNINPKEFKHYLIEKKSKPNNKQLIEFLKKKSTEGYFIRIYDFADDNKGFPFVHCFEDGKYYKTFEEINVD